MEKENQPTKLTHWKKLTNPNYIGAHDLQPNQEAKITILAVSKEMVKGADGKAEELIVAQIKGAKPLILNKTNCKIIAKVLDTPYTENWANKQIIIYSAKVSAFGEMVEAIRVKNQKPL